MDGFPVRILRQLRFLESPIKLGLQFRQPRFVQGPVQVPNRRILAMNLAGNQFVQERKAEVFAEPRQVGLDLARAQQVDAGHQHAIGIKYRLDPLGILLGNQLPPCGKEPSVVI